MIDELTTYALSDFLMFSPEVYFRLFERYNAKIWPAHFLALAIGVALMALIRWPNAQRDRVVALLLAGSWAWIAWAFFLSFYAEINLAAQYAAGAFILQAILLLVAGMTGRLRCEWRGDATGRTGWALVVAAILFFPLIGPLTGRAWSGIELFALTPDPTAIGTLGVLLTTRSRVRLLLVVIPLLWCTVSALTYLTMGNMLG